MSRVRAVTLVRDARFSLVSSDPAWVFDDKLGARGAAANYTEQQAVDLLDLPVPRITSANAVHLMWCVDTHLKLGIQLLERWGFAFVGVPFVWSKRTSTGKCHFGLGRATRKGVELVIMGRRGAGIRRVSASVRQEIVAPVGRHSEKPQLFYDRVVALYGDVQRLEMNARIRRPGWHGWGDEIGANDQTLRTVLGPPG